MSDSIRFQFRGFSPRERITFAVQWLILANVAVFAVQLLADVLVGQVYLRPPEIATPPGGWLTTWLAFQPDHLLGGQVWRVGTYMFLHDGLWHLFVNMLFLFFFGPDVERVLSTRQFFWFYAICGCVGVLASFLVGPITLVLAMVFPGAFQAAGIPSVVGASGAIMGVLIAFAYADPDRKVLMLPLPIPITAKTLVLILIALNILSAFGSGRTSVATHLGGMAVGYVYMRLAPVVRTWLDSRSPRKQKEKSDLDSVGEAVDNILKFHEKKRPRK